MGNSNTPGYLGRFMPLVHWAMPLRYHSIHKDDVARAMVGQSEEAWMELARGQGGGGPRVKVLEYGEMARFFGKGGA